MRPAPRRTIGATAGEEGPQPVRRGRTKRERALNQKSNWKWALHATREVLRSPLVTQGQNARSGLRCLNVHASRTLHRLHRSPTPSLQIKVGSRGTPFHFIART